MNNAFATYRILRQVKGKEKQEEAFRRADPKHADKLGSIIASVNAKAKQAVFSRSSAPIAKRGTKCTHCLKSGHTEDNCFLKHGRDKVAKNARREE